MTSNRFHFYVSAMCLLIFLCQIVPGHASQNSNSPASSTTPVFSTLPPNSFDKTAPVKTQVEQLRKEIQEFPENAMLHYVLAGKLRDLGNSQQSMIELTSGIQLEPLNSYFHYEIAKGYLKEGHLKLALEHALSAESLGLTNALIVESQYSKLLGDIYLKKSNYLSAESYYEKSQAQYSAYVSDLILNPAPSVRKMFQAENKSIVTNLIFIKSKLAHQRPTQKWLRKEMAWYFNNTKPSKRQIEESQRAIPKFQAQIFELDSKPDNPEEESRTRLLLGRSYLTVGKVSLALTELLSAIEWSPKNNDAWRYLAMVYATQGRLPEAANAFQTACRLGNKGSCGLSQKFLESNKLFLKQQVK